MSMVFESGHSTEDGYEMLSGHNGANVAKLARLVDIPAIIKVGLTEAEAYVYMIETNLMQRSFNDLIPLEKIAVMAAHYDKLCCQGKRNDIIRELEALNRIRNVERYLRLKYLIRRFMHQWMCRI